MDTKALRQKILDLAIRGKLVPQDPNDEPASVLLERIRQQKQQMVKEGKLKAKDIKNDSIIFVGEDNLHYEKFADGSIKCIEDEIPFDLPEGWAWSRLGTQITLSNGTSKRRGSGGIDTVVLRLADLTSEEVDLTNTRSINLSSKEIAQYSLKKDDLLFIRVNGSRLNVGKAYVYELENAVAFCDHLMRGTSKTQYICNSYIKYTLGSSDMRHVLEDRIVSAAGQNTISQTSLTSVLLPLPPLQEQKIIVSAIDDAFKRIGIIESEKADLRSIITQAKAKTLDLAIRGKLVPQDPNDEPASVLLERIRAEKEDLIRQGKIKRDKKESVIFRGEDNSYYLRTGNLVESLEDWSFEYLPDSWSVCCLGGLCDYGNCTNVDTTAIPDSAWLLDLEDIEKDTGVVLKKVRKAGRNAASTKHLFHKGQVLYSKLRPYLNKVVLADEDGYCTSEILPLEFDRNILPPYARYYLMSPTFLKYAEKCSYGVKMPRLGTTDGKKAVISVPPIEEQKRIVLAIEQAFAQLASIAKNLS